LELGQGSYYTGHKLAFRNEKSPDELLDRAYSWGMELTDYMLWKLGILAVLAFLYGLITGKT
jgi:hypothetical protein